MGCSLPGSFAHGILQARILEWVSPFLLRGSSQARDWTRISCIAGRFFTNWAVREAWLNITQLTPYTFPSCPCITPGRSLTKGLPAVKDQTGHSLHHIWQSTPMWKATGPTSQTDLACQTALEWHLSEPTQGCPLLWRLVQDKWDHRHVNGSPPGTWCWAWLLKQTYTIKIICDDENNLH